MPEQVEPTSIAGIAWSIILPMLVICFIQAIPKPPEAIQALGMRAGIVVNVTPADRRRLEAIIADRSAPRPAVRNDPP